MDTKDVCQMQELIVKKMKEPNGNILVESFMANFRLLKVNFLWIFHAHFVPFGNVIYFNDE